MANIHLEILIKLKFECWLLICFYFVFWKKTKKLGKTEINTKYFHSNKQAIK